MTGKKIDRRTFITDACLKVAGAGLLISRLGPQTAWAGVKQGAVKSAKASVMEYRTLGKTGLKVSAVGFGALRVKEPAVLFKALDLGVTVIDTAHTYQNGNSEKLVGTVLKEFGRKKAVIITKIFPFHNEQSLDANFRLLDDKRLDEKIDISLKRLQTDYVDVLMIHNIMNAAWPLDEKIMAFCEKLKKTGKARYVGISIHDPRYFEETMDNVIKSKLYDVVLSWLNFKSAPEQIEVLRRVRKAGVGVIAMKTQAGGYKKAATEGLSPQRAALAWVLQQDFVDSTIPGMVNMEEVVENVGAVGEKVGWSDRKTLHAYYRTIRHQYCAMCGWCSATCSSNVDMHTVSRALMYSEGYKDFDLARLTYRWLSPQQNAGACVGCTAPTCRCRNGINIPERMRQAHSLFT